MKKIVVLIVSFLLIGLMLPAMTTAANTSDESDPELEAYISSGFQVLFIGIHVENTGDATAHNVTLTHVTVDGNVIFNFHESKCWTVNLEPGDMTILDPNSMIIGSGKFSISMTVACDEGVSVTDTVEGLIFGPFIFIP